MKNYNKGMHKSIFILLLLLIGIGYAALTSNLDIAGSTKISGNTWDIHFNNIQVTNGSVEATSPATINPTNNTSITYSIELDLPGDFYEFTVDIVNAGTIPGKINLVSNTGIDSQYQDIIEYEVKYTNGKDVLVNDILNAGATKRIKVRVYFKEDIDNDDLPSSDIDLDMVLSITYNQSNESETNAGNLLQNLSNTESCIGKYEGQVTDRVGVTEEATNVYFDRCEQKRNIIFAGYCWQVIRTTETGGLKILYNGDPVDGKCESNRGKHKGIVQTGNESSQSLDSSYLYGSSFTYDLENDTFTLIDTEMATLNASTYQNLFGKYTCKTAEDTCSTIYRVNRYYYNSYAYVSPYSFSNVDFNSVSKTSFNSNSFTPAMAGYMINKSPSLTNIIKGGKNTVFLDYSITSLSYWYDDSVLWDSPVSGNYNLVNPYQISSTSEYPSLVGKYTFMNSDQNYTRTSVYYIAEVVGSTMYVINMTEGNYLSYYNDIYTYGDSYTDNGDNTYTINNPSSFSRLDWFSNYMNVSNKYLCVNAINNTCSKVKYAWNSTKTSFRSVLNNNYDYIYSNGFIYDENTNKYTLSGDLVSFWNYMDSNNFASINNHHYTCNNNTGVCDCLYYIYFVPSDNDRFYVLELKNGQSIEEAYDEMFSNDHLNKYNSSIKGIVDAWYLQNLSSKTNMLEDAVYCNNRSEKDYNESGWNPNGGSVKNSMKFKNYPRVLDISCSREIDQFSLTNNKAKLIYPVGLVSVEELVNLANNTMDSSPLLGNSYYWTMSPSGFFYELSINRVAGNRLSHPTTGLRAEEASKFLGVRPFISLKEDVIFSSGSGSETDPWIIE